MKNSNFIWIIAVVLAILVVVLYFFQPSVEEEEKFAEEVWFETYYNDDREPYGTYVMSELMRTEFAFFNEISGDLVEELPNEENDTGLVYVFIGKRQYMTDDENRALAEFVSRGNTAFIVAEYPTTMMMYSFFDTDRWLSFRDSVVDLEFYHKDVTQTYHLEYLQNFEQKSKTWHYMDFEGFNHQDESIRISSVEGQTACLKVKYGDGYMILHSVPLAFTNISVLEEDGLEYAEHILGHFPDDIRIVLWDEVTKYPHEGTDDEPEVAHPDKSPLQFILASPPLKWAYYLLWMTILLFVLFRSKREQRPIPAIERDENTTMNFINTVGDLYFRQGRHDKLVAQKKKIFLDHIRSHYYLPATVIDAPFFERLSMKSGIEKEEIEEIFITFDRLEGKRVTADELIELHRKIERFHKNSR